ncbi:MAG: immunoglobulin domain-containing protein [Verrucomicrobiota bacterium]
MIAANSSQALNPGDTWLTGWIVGGPGGDVTVNNSSGGYSGNQWIVFNSGDSSPGGILSQTFTNAIGQLYVMSLALQQLAGWSANEVSLSAEMLAGDGSVLASNTFTPPQGTWGIFQLLFMPTATTTTIVLTDTSPQTVAVDLALDDVDIAATNLAPPTILTNPASQTVVAGNSATFNVTLGGGPGVVQWFYETAISTNAIAGANDTNLTVTASGVTAGWYWAVVTNLLAAAISTPAQLTVLGQLLTNGDFETPVLAANSSEALNPGDTWLTGWIVGGPGGDINVNNSSGGYSGNQWISFNAGDSAPGGILGQTFSTSVGQGYVMTLALLQISGSGIPSNEVSLCATALASDGSVLASNTFVPQTAWGVFELPFTPTTTNTTVLLTDTSRNTEAVDLALDDVMVAPTNIAPPTILNNPASQTAEVGSLATFGIEAGGGPGEIQWFHRSALGTNAVPGAIGTELTVTASATTAGSYWATVRNVAGTGVSATAQLAVLGLPFTNGDFETPVIAPNFQYIGLGDTGLPGWTIAGLSGVDLNDSSGGGYSGNQWITFHYHLSTGGVLEQTFTAPLGQSQLLSLALEQVGGTAGQVSLTVTAVAGDGSILASNTFVPPLNAWRLFGLMFTPTTEDTSIILTDSSPQGNSWYMALDDTAVTATNLAPPIILTSPVNQTAAAGSPAMFNIALGGGPSAVQWFYGTVIGSNAITGGIDTNLTVTASGASAGYYWAIATNILGGAVSTAAQLTVTGQSFTNGDFETPTIVANSSQTLNPGDTWLTGWIVGGPGGDIVVSNSAAAYSGNQWIDFNANNSPPGGILAQTFNASVGQRYEITFALRQFGGTAGKVSLSAKALAGDGSILASNTFVPGTGAWGVFGFLFTPTTTETTIVLTDTSPQTTSVDLALDDVLVVQTNLVAPEIMTNPISQTAAAGNSVTFNIALGGGPGVLQWFEGTPLGSNAISGANGTNLTLTASGPSAGFYWATATNLAGGAVSAAAQLTVLGLPFTNGDFEVPVLSSGSSSIIQPGQLSLTGWAVGGPSNAVYLKHVTGAYSGSQWINFYDSSTHPAGILEQTFTTSVGQSYVMTLALEEGYPFGVSLSARALASDGSVLASNTFVPSGSGWRLFRLLFTPTTTNTAIIFTDTSSETFGSALGLDDVVISPTNFSPTILTNPVSQNTVAGSPISFTVAATGSPPPDFHWQVNNLPIPSAPNRPSLTISNVVPTDGGSYSVIASNSAGSAVSSNAVLLVTYVMQTAPGEPAQIATGQLTLPSAVQPANSFVVGSVDPTSTQGGAVQLANGFITYSPPPAFIGADSFDYVLAPSFGLAVNGAVTVLVEPPNSNGSSVLGATVSGGQATIQFAGNPGTTYNFEASTDLVRWSIIGSATASPYGLFEFKDTNASLYPHRYYRTSD